MKKLAGLLAFAVALAAAILITQYYTAKTKPPEPPPPPPAAPAPPAEASAPVVFKAQLATLNLSSKKASVSLSLERGTSSPAPASVWVWAYFFTQETAGKYCVSVPVEVKNTFDAGVTRARVTVELTVANCPAPRTATTTSYARVNVASESSFAARLPEQRISYDISQASPVILQGARR